MKNIQKLSRNTDLKSLNAELGWKNITVRRWGNE